MSARDDLNNAMSDMAQGITEANRGVARITLAAERMSRAAAQLRDDGEIGSGAFRALSGLRSHLQDPLDAVVPRTPDDIPTQRIERSHD